MRDRRSAAEPAQTRPLPRGTRGAGSTGRVLLPWGPRPVPARLLTGGHVRVSRPAESVSGPRRRGPLRRPRWPWRGKRLASRVCGLRGRVSRSPPQAPPRGERGDPRRPAGGVQSRPRVSRGSGDRRRLKDVGKTAVSTVVRAFRPPEVLAGAIDRGSSRECGLRAGGPSALGWAVRCLVDGFEAGCSRLPSPGCHPGPH